MEHSEQMVLVQAMRSVSCEPKSRRCSCLRQNGQLTYEQIAEMLGVPTGTVKTRMRLALNRLRETLAKTM